MNGARRTTAALAAGILLTTLTGEARPQAIPRDRYLDYLPLEVPPLVQATPASVQLHLFGDPEAPGYRDVAPHDGIDDERAAVLQDLGARFGPIMVLNTTNLPMDFRRFMEESRSFNLYVDTWSLLGNPTSLLRSDEVDLLSIVDAPCDRGDARGWDSSGDCRLLDLLRRYDPRDPDYPDLAPRSVPTDRETFEVMFFDFPGDGPESWKSEFESGYSELLPGRFRDFLKVYVHPFVHESVSPLHGSRGFELVLQYYFFYPTNDGGNNHEGDWEHINVSITPQDAVDRLLTRDEVLAILEHGADWGEDRGDPLVIRYIDYYFHHQVYRMDYASPNVYAPAVDWKAELDGAVAERQGQEKLWKLTRHNAWWDHEETVVNTHPICFVGADNKGLDQALSAPGGKNRDSHGTYPYPGMYKDIGPGGATEQINSYLDVKKYWQQKGGDISGRDQTRFGRGDAVPYTTTDRVEILPDWERVLDPVMSDPVARRDWFWMVLPVRWGYPATESPFAGVVGNADTGNLSPFGPMSQPHWNRTGSEGGSHAYEPHAFDTLFPLGLQDSFVNSWGYLNLTLPVLASVPPIDFLWRLVAFPFRVALQRNDPVFFPSADIPRRFVGTTVGASKVDYNDDVTALLLNGEPGAEALTRLIIDEPGGVVAGNPTAERSTSWWWQVNFYLGRTFTTQNTLLNARSGMRLDTLGASGNTHTITGNLNLWEYAGSFRFNLSHSAFSPYLKLGYGWTWYRVEDAAYDGDLLQASTGEWINQPSLKTFSDAMPNSFHVGGGLEIHVIRSTAPLLKGTDLSLVAEVTYTTNNLGLDDWLLVAGSGDLSDGLVDHVTMKRWTIDFGLNLGF